MKFKPTVTILSTLGNRLTIPFMLVIPKFLLQPCKLGTMLGRMGIISLILVGCSLQPTQERMTQPSDVIIEKESASIHTPVPTSSGRLEPTESTGIAEFAFTNHSPDGNRFVSGVGGLPDYTPIEIPLGGIPIWVVGIPQEGGSVWAAVLEDGRIQAFKVGANRVIETPINPNHLAAGMPPVMRLVDNELSLLENASPEASLFTYPIPIGNSGVDLAFITSEGDIIVKDASETYRFDIQAIPDARILSDGNGKLLCLSDATTRYDHGVVGDAVEASGFVLLDQNGQWDITSHIRIGSPSVVEGLSPIWADLNGDKEREIILTQSNAQTGAKIVVYSSDGVLLAEGPPIGTGFRWRHQLAIAPFGINQELEIAVVKTPHIGGVLEFYRLVGDSLIIKTSISGFSTHSIGSRNLDTALAGDFDGDGMVEIILPDQSHRNLMAVSRTKDGAQIDWSLPLEGKYSSNLAAVQTGGSLIGIGIGTEDKILRLWVIPTNE